MINKFAEAATEYAEKMEALADEAQLAEEDFLIAFEDFADFHQAMVNIRNLLNQMGLSATPEYKQLDAFVHDLTADVSAVEGILAS